MEKRSFQDIVGLFGEIITLRKVIPEIKPVFETFDTSERPEESLEKILDTAKKKPHLDNLLKINQTYELVSKAEKTAEKFGWGPACLEVLDNLGVKAELFLEEEIPTGESSLYVCNHPYGLLDSVILVGKLGSFLQKKSKQLKLIGMNQLRFIKGIEEILYFVHSTTHSSNFSVLKESLKYLDKGGNLAICPSGTMSGRHLREYPWENTLASYIKHSSYVIPMWFSGPDHEGIYNLLASNKKTENFRRAFSLREAWNKSGKNVYLRVGKPIPSGELLSQKKDAKERIQYLRDVAESLKIEV